MTNVWNLNELLEEDIDKKKLARKLSEGIQNNKRRNMLNKTMDKYNEENSKHPFKNNSIVYVKTYQLSNKGKSFKQRPP